MPKLFSFVAVDVHECNLVVVVLIIDVVLVVVAVVVTVVVMLIKWVEIQHREDTVCLILSVVSTFHHLLSFRFGFMDIFVVPVTFSCKQRVIQSFHFDCEAPNHHEQECGCTVGCRHVVDCCVAILLCLVLLTFPFSIPTRVTMMW